MQLTDAEIRQILIEQKRKRRRKQRIKRRISLAVLLILIIVIAVAIITHREELGLVHYRGVIFLDAGHGGEDPGAETADGRQEKDDTLAIALKVKEYLEKEKFQVYMSRDTDTTVDRAERGRMANAVNADFMLSIHRNQGPSGGTGVEMYIPSANDHDSQVFSRSIMDALVEAGFVERSINVGVYKDETDDYLENSESDMPSCLVEVGFINNADDNVLFDEHLDENAEAIAKGISEAFAELYESEEE